MAEPDFRRAAETIVFADIKEIDTNSKIIVAWILKVRVELLPSTAPRAFKNGRFVGRMDDFARYLASLVARVLVDNWTFTVTPLIENQTFALFRIGVTTK